MEDPRDFEQSSARQQVYDDSSDSNEDDSSDPTDDDDESEYEFLDDDAAMEAESAPAGRTPFLQLDMGGYTLHPRLRSLTVSQVDEAADPVNEHIRVVIQ